MARPNPKIEALQNWLNALGHKPQLVVDGLPGPATRQALLNIFVNRNAPAITAAQLQGFADRLGWTLAQLRAVDAVESGGRSFDADGRPMILWERHYFWKRLQFLIPLVSDPRPGGYTLDANHNGINDSWEKLVEGAMRAPAWAFESASWGRFQIMGAHWKKLGYLNAPHFAGCMRLDEFQHFEAFARYVERFGLVKAGRAISDDPADCEAFAAGYNGPKFRKFDYHTKLARALERFAGQ